MKQGLTAFETFNEPGIKSLPHSWDAGWERVIIREKGAQSNDSRSPRNTEPQYQTVEDRLFAEHNA